MDVGDDGHPRIGPEDLGVRVNLDIKPDELARVRPGTGGMSVTADDPFDLPRPHRPPEFGGTGRRPVWQIPVRQLPGDLVYRADPKRRTHGFIEPNKLMELREYQSAIASTAPVWSLTHV
jgi:hypothetical protein